MPLDGNPNDYVLPSDTVGEDEVARVLRRAAADIRLRGLARGIGEDPFGRRCIVNALDAAARSDEHFNAALDAVAAFARVPRSFIWLWSDHATHYRVVTALESAATARGE